MNIFRQEIKVKRKRPGFYNNAGFYEVSGEDIEFNIKVSIQPISGSDLILLPENRREEELLKLYTDIELFGAIKGNSINCDIIQINGMDYEVVKVSRWQNNVIPHYKVLVSKRTTNDPLPFVTEQ